MAYLLLIIDISHNPPKVLGTGIYSEETPTMMGSRRTTVVLAETVGKFQEARMNLYRYKDHPYYKWAFDLLAPAEQL